MDAEAIAIHDERIETIEDAMLYGRLRGLRAVIVLFHLGFDGPVRNGLFVARYLRDHHGMDVRVVAMSTPGEGTAMCDAWGIPWQIIPCEANGWGTIGRLVALLRFAKHLRSLRPDVILSYLSTPNLVCGYGWRLTGARVLVWNQLDQGLGFTGSLPERLAVRATPLFISNSSHGATFLTKKMGANPKHTHVIHFGVHLEPACGSRDAVRTQLGISDDTTVASMVANLTEWKDHFTLLRAWRLVVDHATPRKRPVLLLLAGRHDEPQYSQLVQLCGELGLTQHVRFLGLVSDVGGLLEATDLGVFSSRFEGIPNGVLECMAHGLAVVGTDLPGIREALGPSWQRCLAPVGNARELARKIIQAIDYPDVRSELGSANQQRVHQEFNSESMGHQVASLICSALA